MKDNKGKQYYLTVKNTVTGKDEKVFVTEAVYRAYKKPIRKEQSRQRREDRCLVRNKYGNLVRCTEDCKACEYYLSGQKPGVNGLSLDVFKEQGLEVADARADLENDYIRREEMQTLKDAYKDVVFERYEYRLVFKPDRFQNLLYVIGGFFGRIESFRLVFVGYIHTCFLLMRLEFV